ncbi:hypothetical protein BACPLE_00978 [Phocaeicola plebeius DSM 17135]|uniref:Uncharacterized protein n=1 Tax=Phocaeicola plebeius (strain DSM 17135 / JCM 12973 / CCUG 54634 / M2) TaxID=484018 RepID=B5CW88_PHOPM|nr:hypothetical protein BACPLE_00978 [Phocaeicola plebeius DSM 17135]
MYEKMVYFPNFFNIFYKVQKVEYSYSCVVYHDIIYIFLFLCDILSYA